MTSTRRSFVYAANNRNGYLCGRELAGLGLSPELLLLHPSPRRKWGEEICSLFPRVPTVEWSCDALNDLRDVKAGVLLSVNFGYIFSAEILSLFRHAVNLHTGYLPYNKGSHPNVWSIIEGTPAGVTLHLMTPDVDTGEIISRREVPVSPLETGKSLYEKLEEASVEVIGETFVELLTGEVQTTPMPDGGSLHLAREFGELRSLSLEETTSVGDLLRRLRALSFPPYKNAYYMKGDKRVYVDIVLTEESSSSTEDARVEN